MIKWKDKNAGKHPADPAYIDWYNPEEDYENWLEEQERKYEEEKCK